MKYIKLFESNKELSLKEKLIFILKINDELWQNEMEFHYPKKLNHFLSIEIDADSYETHTLITDEVANKASKDLELKSEIIKFYKEIKDELSKIPTIEVIEECMTNLFDDYEYHITLMHDSRFGFDYKIELDVDFIENFSIICDIEDYIKFNKNLEFSSRLLEERGFIIGLKLTNPIILSFSKESLFTY
jgi:hypothetical protein